MSRELRERDWVVANIRSLHRPIPEGSGGTGDTPTRSWNGPCRADGSAWPCDAEYAARLLADTPSVEPAVEPLPEWACGVMGLCERRKGHEGTHSTSVDRAAGLRPSVEPAGLDVERLAEALKEYDAGRLRVPFAPSHVLSPDQSPSRFHRAWAKTLLDYAARLPTQASDSPEPKETM